MVKEKVLYILAIVVFSYLSLIFFLPKQNLYYSLVNTAKDYKVDIISTSHDDGFFSLDVGYKTVIAYENINALEVGHINIKPFGLYNSITLNNTVFNDLISKVMPQTIDYININYNILFPTSLNIQAEIGASSCDGEFDLLSNKIYMKCNFTNKFMQKNKILIYKMKKQKNGEYLYEKQL